MKYSLEIYEPGSRKDVWEVFESDLPFSSIEKGDILNPNSWEHQFNPENRVEVVGLEHSIWKSPTENITKHKVIVYTELIKD